MACWRRVASWGRCARPSSISTTKVFCTAASRLTLFTSPTPTSQSSATLNTPFTSSHVYQKVIILSSRAYADVFLLLVELSGYQRKTSRSTSASWRGALLKCWKASDPATCQTTTASLSSCGKCWMVHVHCYRRQTIVMSSWTRSLLWPLQV